MSLQAKPPRTRRSFLIEIVIASSIWVVNLYQIATTFHAMTFMPAATAIMIFLFAPVFIIQALTGLRRDKV